MTHEYEDCPARPEIANLKGWQQRQNGSLEKLAIAVQDLCEGDAYRRGGRDMLKWILGFAGIGTITGIAGLFVQLFG
jgi:hypothetical protein